MEPLKNRLNEAYVSGLAKTLKGAWADFPQHDFRQSVLDEDWEARELKQRMRHITQCLKIHLPEDYREALVILLKAAPRFSGFEAMFFPEFVELYGRDDWEVSLPALADLTRYSSSEFAVRPFIKQDPKRMMAEMLRWAGDENYHVRRLASEGCRPRLPWAMALPAFKKNPSPILPILEKLKNDEEEYVRRSVANNLNDISKDHPERVLQIATDWLKEDPSCRRLVKHACRTLLKAGDAQALALFGFGLPAGVSAGDLVIEPNLIAIGEKLSFRFKVKISKACRLRLEYGVSYLKSNGTHSRKIFKISEKDWQPGEKVVVRGHAFKDLTTRKHYPGKHFLDIVINGKTLEQAEFQLNPKPTV